MGNRNYIGSAVTQLGLTTAPNRLLAASDVHTYSSISTATNAPIRVENSQMGMNSTFPGLGVEVNDEVLGEAQLVIRNK